MNQLFLNVVIVCSILGYNQIEPKGTDDSFTLIQNFEKSVLKKRETGKECILELNDSLTILEYSCFYLGQSNYSKFNFLYYEVLSGNKISPRLNAYLSIYSSNERKLGYYYLGSSVSVKLLDDCVIFSSVAGCNQSTEICFRDSIPQTIFIRCKEKDGKKLGNLYGFNKLE
jgi:hypothetical protein